MKLTYTRLLEGDFEKKVPMGDNFSQADFVKLLARSKAVLIRSEENEIPMDVNRFASIISSFHLKKYPYEGEHSLLEGEFTFFTMYLFLFIMSIDPSDVLLITNKFSTIRGGCAKENHTRQCARRRGFGIYCQ
jgi:hypothetical protein